MALEDLKRHARAAIDALHHIEAVEGMSRIDIVGMLKSIQETRRSLDGICNELEEAVMNSGPPWQFYTWYDGCTAAPEVEA